MYQQKRLLQPNTALCFFSNFLLVFILSFLLNTVRAQQNTGCTNDVLAPVITPVSSNIRIALDAAGNRSISLADIATVTDNCNPAPASTLSAVGFNCSHVGQQMVTVTATDGSFGTTASEPPVSFSDIYGVAIDATGNIYLADFQNQAIRKISTTGMVTTLAGSGIKSFANGIGTAASFNDPVAVAVDGSGNVFVADQGNNRIRKITPTGVVTTFAGSGTAGSADGTGTAASFNHPYGIATDAAGNVYVSDTYNHKIRKISPGGVVTTVGGSTLGYADGVSTIAQFDRPMGLAVDASGNIYVADLGNILIRKISPSGLVSTLAGNGQEGFADGVGIAASFRTPWHITINPSGDLFITDSYNYAVRKITPAGLVSTIAGNGSEGSLDGDGSIAQFSNPHGIVSDPSGNLFISDVFNYKIRKISTSYVVSTFAGGMYGAENGNIGGFTSGNQSILQIAVTVEQAPPVFTSAPQPEITITIGENCTALIPDFKSSATATSGCGPVTLTQSPTQGVPAPLGRRPITIIATDIYGMQSYQTSYIDIVDGTAPIITPVSNNIILPLNSNGTRTITLADIATIKDNCNANPVYKISPSTFNCSSAGQQTVTVTATDGTFGGTNPSAVSFSQVYGVAVDVTGNIYLADLPNHSIRKISATGIVTTLAGSGSSGFANGVGASASFHNPVAVAVDGSGNVYVADQINNRIRKITAAGVVTTFAGSGAPGSADGIGVAASFNNPYGIAIDAAGNLFVGDTENSRIRKISPAGVVTTIAGSSPGNVNGIGTASKFDRPMGLTVDAAGNIYVVDNSNQLIRKISSSGVVSTLAGSGIMGFTDGTGSGASFRSPWHITIDPAGNLYVTDMNNHAIRKITQAGVVSTIAGNGTNGSAEGPGVTARFYYPFGIASDNIGNLFIGDGLNYKIRKITPNYVVSTFAGSGVSGFQNGNIGTPATGNQSSLQIPVTILGRSAPVFTTTQANVSVVTNISCSASLADYASTAIGTSSCGGAVTVTQSPLAGTLLSIGTSTVILTAIDVSGNTATQTFIVAVEGAPPVFTSAPQPEITIRIGTDCTAPIPDFKSSATATSGCGPVALTQSPTQDVPAPLGRRPVTIIATDIYGKESYQTTYINFIDGTAPLITPYTHNITLPLNYDGTRPVSIYDLGTVTDNCNPNPLYKFSPSSFNCSDLGPQNITITATDGSFGTATTPAAVAFFNPYDLSFDRQGNLRIADYQNYKIRNLSTAGVVSTLAGNGQRGSVNGTGAGALFDNPTRLALDVSGNAYVVDNINQRIRKVTPSGVVTTYAGSTDGFSDGPVSTARFSYPNNIAIDGSDNLYIVDNGNNRIRKITPAGMVSTFAGDGLCGPDAYCTVTAIGADVAGNIYIGKDNKIRKITPAGVATWIAGTGSYGSVDGMAASASFAEPRDIAIDGDANIWVLDNTSRKIRKITPSGQVESVTINYNSTINYFFKGITISPSGSLFITIGNSVWEKKQDGTDVLIAGSLSNYGDIDGVVGISATGNQVSILVPVTVIGAPPFFTTTQGNVSINSTANCSAALPDYAQNARATVPCGATVTFTQTPVPGTLIPVGETTVTIQASNSTGNFALQQFKVMVADQTAPVITPVSNNIVLAIGANGTRTLQLSELATVTDNCNSNPNVRINLSTFNCTNIGNQIVTVETTDGSFGIGPNPAAVSFNAPYGVVVDAAGNVYVAANNQIRKITPSGLVSTLAGSGTEGSVDGIGTAASFYALHGLAIDASGNLYTAEFYSRKVRKVSPSGVVSTLAGTGLHGSTDGPAATATFGVIYGVTVDTHGNVFVADASNNKIRKISASGMVSTYAGTGVAGAADGPAATATFSTPVSLAVDNSGNLFVGEQFKIRKITPAGIVSTFVGSNLRGFHPGTGTNAIMERPMGLVFDAAGNLFATQEGAGRILKITPSAVVSAFAGHYGETTINGTGTAATFRSPEGAGIDAAGNLYVADVYLNNVRRISPEAVVTTLAGSGLPGSQNGSISGITGNYSTVQIPVTVKDVTAPVISPVSGNIIIPLNSNGTRTITFADIATVTDNCNNNSSVRINPSTFDCSQTGLQTITVETTDGNFGTGPNPSAVSFTNPQTAVADAAGNVYIAANNQIRKISTSGEVTTLAGNGVSATVDGMGTAASFSDLHGLAIDAAGNLFTAEITSRKVRKVTPAGEVTTVAGSGAIGSSDGPAASASFTWIYGVVVDPQGNIFVADAGNYKIRKISTSGIVSTYAGTGALGSLDGPASSATFNYPSSIAMDNSGNIYVGEQFKIRKITPAGIVSTFAGSTTTGNVPGIGANARIARPMGMVFDAAGNLFATQEGAGRIIRVTPAAEVSTFAGHYGETTINGTGTDATFRSPEGLGIDAAGNLYVADWFLRNIRKITPSADVTTFAGSGLAGSQNGNISGGNSGNYSSLQIQVQVKDIIPPVITCPLNFTGPTTSIHPNQTGWATATDNCASGLIISYTDNTAEGCNMLRTWKATDASGNFSTCTQSIAVPQMTVSLGPDMYILYGALGYTGCRTITPLIAGGAGPYTYVWSSTHAAVNNATSATVTACNTVETTHTYTVTVTSANGCTATATVQLTFINISCSNNANNEKVTVCLRPPGNPTNCNTICVSPSAAQVLINNGSYYGKCLPGCEIPMQSINGNPGTNNQQQNAIEDDAENEGGQSFEVKVRNNPTQTSFSLTITSSTKEKIRVRVFDVLGRSVEMKQNVVAGELVSIGGKYGKGVFFAEIIQGGNRKTVKLVKQ